MEIAAISASMTPSDNEICREVERIDDSDTSFWIAYQPRVSVVTGRTVCAEALIRYSNSRGKILYPAQFLGTIERNGMLSHLDNWVMQRAIRQGALWERDGGPRVSVNVSVDQIENRAFPQQVEAMLLAEGLSPHRLEIEVNENCIIRDQASAGRSLDEIREMGIDVALDDFGTGSMPITNLQWMPVNVIKIGQDMCERLVEDVKYQRLSKAMVAFAKTMHAKAVLEGVERAAQFGVAAENLFDEVQGYYFSRAVMADKLIHDFSERIGAANGSNEVVASS